MVQGAQRAPAWNLQCGLEKLILYSEAWSLHDTLVHPTHLPRSFRVEPTC